MTMLTADETVGLVYRYGDKVSPGFGVVVGLDCFGLWVKYPMKLRLGGALPGLENSIVIRSGLTHIEARNLVNRCLSIAEDGV